MPKTSPNANCWARAAALKQYLLSVLVFVRTPKAIPIENDQVDVASVQHCFRKVRE